MERAGSERPSLYVLLGRPVAAAADGRDGQNLQHGGVHTPVSVFTETIDRDQITALLPLL
jgi:hypothetical protein